MGANIIDGKTIAADLRGKVAATVQRLARDHALVPGLAVVLVGNNPASESYVGSKVKMIAGSGMRSFDHRLPETTSEAELLALVARLNDPARIVRVRAAIAESSTSGSVLLDSPFQNAPKPAASIRGESSTISRAG